MYVVSHFIKGIEARLEVVYGRLALSWGHHGHTFDHSGHVALGFCAGVGHHWVLAVGRVLWHLLRVGVRLLGLHLRWWHLGRHLGWCHHGCVTGAAEAISTTGVVAGRRHLAAGVVAGRGHAGVLGRDVDVHGGDHGLRLVLWDRGRVGAAKSLRNRNHFP